MTKITREANFANVVGLWVDNVAGEAAKTAVYKHALVAHTSQVRLVAAAAAAAATAKQGKASSQISGSAAYSKAIGGQLAYRQKPDVESPSTVDHIALIIINVQNISLYTC